MDRRERLQKKQPRGLYSMVAEKVAAHGPALLGVQLDQAVLQQQLPFGDYALQRSSHILDCIVERKRVGDLVSRSVHGSQRAGIAVSAFVNGTPCGILQSSISPQMDIWPLVDSCWVG